jgi:hypothetical protein
VSHGNFDVVSILLDSKVANPNILNKAGYTCTMLISLAHIQNHTHRAVVSRLFSLGVNLHLTFMGKVFHPKQKANKLSHIYGHNYWVLIHNSEML